MWKIKIIYKDNSSCTLTGSHKEIPLELAVNYFNKYVADHVIRSARYQQYPKRIIVRWTCLRKLKNCGRERILTMKKNEASVIIGNIPVNGKDGCYSITEYQEAKTVAVQALEEIQQYRAIGTPEECRAAVEKQTAKKVVSFEYHNGTINYGCPVCKWKIISKINGEWCVGTFNEYCDRCGQKLDWSDEDEKI